MSSFSPNGSASTLLIKSFICLLASEALSLFNHASVCLLNFIKCSGVPSLPNIKFSSDFIIGYPGETYSDFKETLKLMSDIKFINSYSFVFNERPGTPAYYLPKVDKDITKDRLKEFQLLAEKIKTDYRKNLIDKISKVLFENKIKNENKYFGRDEHFNSVIVESKTDLSGKIRDVKISKVNQNTLYGEINLNLKQRDCAA